MYQAKWFQRTVLAGQVERPRQCNIPCKGPLPRVRTCWLIWTLHLLIGQFPLAHLKSEEKVLLQEAAQWPQKGNWLDICTAPISRTLSFFHLFILSAKALPCKLSFPLQWISHPLITWFKRDAKANSVLCEWTLPFCNKCLRGAFCEVLRTLCERAPKYEAGHHNSPFAMLQFPATNIKACFGNPIQCQLNSTRKRIQLITFLIKEDCTRLHWIQTDQDTTDLQAELGREFAEYISCAQFALHAQDNGQKRLPACLSFWWFSLSTIPVPPKISQQVRHTFNYRKYPHIKCALFQPKF